MGPAVNVMNPFTLWWNCHQKSHVLDLSRKWIPLSHGLESPRVSYLFEFMMVTCGNPELSGSWTSGSQPAGWGPKKPDELRWVKLGCFMKLVDLRFIKPPADQSRGPRRKPNSLCTWVGGKEPVESWVIWIGLCLIYRVIYGWYMKWYMVDIWSDRWLMYGVIDGWCISINIYICINRYLNI